MSLFINRFFLKPALLLHNQIRLCYPLTVIRCLSKNSLLQNTDVQKYFKYIEAEYNEYRNDSKVKLNQTVLAILDKRRILENDLKNLLAMSCDNDEELKKLISEEKQTYLNDMNQLNENLIDLLTPGMDVDRTIMLEVSCGVGGLESMLFAKEIYDMYFNYAIFKNWSWSEADIHESDLGGIHKASAMISGSCVHECMIHEAGIHRVQRVPETERQGRVHTSTCSVSVIPQPYDEEVVLNEKDLKISYKTSSGAGGQNVNKRETCVRVVHVPTGERESSFFIYNSHAIIIFFFL